MYTKKINRNTLPLPKNYRDSIVIKDRLGTVCRSRKKATFTTGGDRNGNKFSLHFD